MKNVFKNQVVHTVISTEAVAKKAKHTTKVLSFAARIQTAVEEVDEPWEFAAKAANLLPKREQALYGQLLKWVEVYAPAREREEADTLWPEVWAGEWPCDDPDTLWDNRWHAARRERLEAFRAAFAQLLPMWITECLKKPLY